MHVHGVCFFKLFIKHAPLQQGNTTCWIIPVSFSGLDLSTQLNSKSLSRDSSRESDNVPYCSCSKSIEFMNFINEIQYSVINCCLLTGQFLLFRVLLLRSSLCVWSKVHWYSKWSIVWSPFLQTQVAWSSSLDQWRYEICPGFPMSCHHCR
jgi:hypothetical protein